MRIVRILILVAMLSVTFLFNRETPLLTIHNFVCVATVLVLATVMSYVGELLPKAAAAEEEDHGDRVAEMYVCCSAEEANQYLALGPEWDLKEVMGHFEPSDEGDTPGKKTAATMVFVVVRWETAKDRARIRRRDQSVTSKQGKE